MSAPESCASCGAALGPRARFCRACGAAVEATAVAPARDDEPHAPQPSRARGPMLALAAFAACLLLGGLIAAGAYLLSRDDAAEEPTVGLPAAPSASLERALPDPARGVASADSPTVTEPEEPRVESELSPGRYVQAGSFRSPEGAQREVDRLLGYGIDVAAVPADWASELLPGFQVLLVGPLATSGEEKRVLRRLEDANVAGFGRELTPSEAISGPEAVAGAWSGELERSHLRGGRRPSAYRVELGISADGESGTVEHLDRGCSGSLTLIEDSGYSLAYAESVVSGRCPPGGVWHLRPEGDEITAVWLHDDRQVMIDGTAEAAIG